MSNSRDINQQLPTQTPASHQFPGQLYGIPPAWSTLLNGADISPTSSFRPYVSSSSFDWISRGQVINGVKRILATKENNSTHAHAQRNIAKAASKTHVCPSPNKRRKPEEPDEQMVRVPLESGWRRMTHVRLITRTGVRGDVVYYSPDEKKLKSFQEIDRYLLKNANSETSNKLSRHNFTFSSKFLVGTFVRHLLLDGACGTRPEELSEEEIINLIRKENPDFKLGETPRKRPSRQISSNQSDMLVAQPVFRSSHTPIVMEATITEDVQTRSPDCKINMNRLLPNPNPVKSEMYWPTVCNLMFIRHQVEDNNKMASISKHRWTREQRIDAIVCAKLKETVNDLLIKDCRPLPEFEPIPNTVGMERGIAFGNCLMACEIISTFGTKFKELADSYSASTNRLLNDDTHVSALALNQSLYIEDETFVQDICIDFLRALSKSGHFDNVIGDLPINQFSLGAILCCAFKSKTCQYDRLSEELNNIPFYRLSAVQKSQALRWLCDEFLSSRSFYTFIEEHVNSFSLVRHQLWKIDGEVGKPKGSSVHQATGGSGDESDEIHEEDASIQTEDTLCHEQGRTRSRISSASDLIRLKYLGTDRYYRRYWFAQKHNVIYVEGTIAESPCETLAAEKVEDQERLKAIAETLASDLSKNSTTQPSVGEDCDGPVDLSMSGNVRFILETLNGIDESEIKSCHLHHYEESLDIAAYQKLHFESSELPRLICCPIQWYMLRDKETLKELMDSLCKRGERESQLFETFTRNFAVIHDSLLDKKSNDIEDEKRKRFEKTASEQNQQHGLIDDRVEKSVREVIDKLQSKITVTSSGVLSTLTDNSRVESSRERLLLIESRIEQRYVHEKYRSKMEMWRDQVNMSKSISHIYLLAWQLENQMIAWDKTIMKVRCQICNGDKEDDRLILCDGCDHGYHTYCVQPSLDALPEDEWFCYYCLNKNSQKHECVCFVCGMFEEDLVLCEHCSKHYHQRCLSFKSQRKLCRVCAGCAAGHFGGVSGSGSSNKKSKKFSVSLEQVELNQELRKLVNRLIKQESSRPFRDPVDRSIYPDYYQLIQNPVNLRQIKKNTLAYRYDLLRNDNLKMIRFAFRYTTVHEFTRDVRQMFTNCNIYNEDDSRICHQGRQLIDVFNKLLVEIDISNCSRE